MEVISIISFSKLLLGKAHFGDRLRYSKEAQNSSQGATNSMGPVVVWNCTKTCNLKCQHCYAGAILTETPEEMSTLTAKRMFDSLVDYKVPALLISGGEPLMRKDIWELLAYAKKIGLRTVISTNGTLIDSVAAEKIKSLSVSYVGISLDGLETINDEFRGVDGAFRRTMQGIKNCQRVGQKTGLRLSLSKNTIKDLPAIFDLIESERISRVCFYHLVYSGRGEQLVTADLNFEEKRRTLDYIIEKTFEFEKKGLDTEILTVDNHCDGIYLYQYMKNKDINKAKEILRLLSINGGNRSGSAIGAIDWQGNVYIDQFTRNRVLGNTQLSRFSSIWQGENNEFLEKLRNRKEYLGGRCKFCKWLEQCNGNFRARALSTGDFWAADPACYFTDKEIIE